MTLGERIREERKRIGLSQEQLAEHIGVSRQTVYKWENEQAMPDLKNLQKLAEAFHQKVEQLLQEEPTSAPQQTSLNEAIDQGERLIRKHWRKGGFLLIYRGVTGLIFALLAYGASYAFFSQAFQKTQGFFGGDLLAGQVSLSYTIGSSPFGGMEMIFYGFAFVIGMVGLGLLISGVILVWKDREINRKKA